MIGVLEFDSRRGLGIFLFTTAFRTALGPTQPPNQWVRVPLSLGVKRQGRETDHSPPSIVEVKQCMELYLHYPNTPSWRGAQLKHRDNFTLTFSRYARNKKKVIPFLEGRNQLTPWGRVHTEELTVIQLLPAMLFRFIHKTIILPVV
jgi:hypothetical protein